MKFTNLLTKTITTVALGAMLLTTVANASTIKAPNMGGVSVQYANLVSAATTFGSNFGGNLGALVTNSFVQACYTSAAIDAAIANTNNAISALNNIQFLDNQNITVSGSASSLVRDNSFVAQAKSYLSAAQLANAVQFSLSTAATPSVSSGSVRPTSEYYDTLTFTYSTNLYSTGASYTIVQPNGAGVTINGVSSVVTTLNNYVSLLNAVKAFDQAAGCYDATTVTPPTVNPPTNTTACPVCVVPTNGNAIIYVSNVTISRGDTFSFMDGVEAYDNRGDGADLTDQVTVSGKVNTAVAGKYKLTYRVKGSNGNTVTKIITVTVK